MQPFLTANWRYLAMLNYVVDPQLIAPLVPAETEIDFENGETFLSVVGFLFLDTRLLGLPVPLHRDFEEVNLRFYVRRKSADTWRRGVVFIRELVPRRAIALVARAFYGENYVAVPMKHEIEHLDQNLTVEYSWRRGRKWESVKMTATGEPQSIPAGSHAEFITEHYWGYTALQSGCSEYRVEHPRWKIWDASDFELNADVATLYGEQFAETLNQRPRSAFIADGSPITVRKREYRRARQPAAAAAATGMKLLESFNVLGPAGSSDRPRSGRPFAPGFLLQLEAEDCRVIRRLRHYTRFLLRTLREFKQRLQGVWKKRSKK